MDSVNNLCQFTCPSANLLFGEPFSKKCITNCTYTGYYFLYADTLTRLCTPNCSGNQFADPYNYKCITTFACSQGALFDPYYRKCVLRCYNQTYAYSGTCYTVCPLATLYADEISQSCVTALNCPSGSFADPTKQRCVQYCDIASNRFANTATRKC
jgi:hypothetical protein